MPVTSPTVSKDPAWSARLSTGLIGLLAIGLTACRAPCAAAVTQGLTLCTSTLLPALFPFFVLSGLVTETGLALRLGVLFAQPMARIFHLPGSSAALFFLGALGGYPTGARAVAELYRQGQCSKPHAERMLALCNNCGPGFFLGIAGGAVLGSTAAGLALWLIHLAAALLSAGFFRSQTFPDFNPLPAPNPGKIPQALVKSVSGAVQSSLGVCGFVLFFSVLLCLLQESGLLPFLSMLLAIPLGSNAFAQAFFSGLLEISCGVTALAGCTAALPLKGAAAAFLLSFGGCSVLFQTLQQIEGTDLSLRLALKGKLLQALFSATGAFLYLSLFKNDSPVSNILHWHDLSRSPAFLPILAMLFCLFALVKVRKSRYNTKRAQQKGGHVL